MDRARPVSLVMVERTDVDKPAPAQMEHAILEFLVQIYLMAIDVVLVLHT